MLLPVLLAVVASLATASLARAYPPPATSATTTQSCASVPQGGTCQLTFHFFNGSGQGVSGDNITLTVTGPGSVNPTAGVTNGNGDVNGLFTASNSACGNATVTATDTNGVSTQTVINVVCGNSAPLPNTSATPSGTNPLVYVGILLAALVLVGGVITLRQTRRTV